MIEIAEEALSATQAIALLREALGDPDLKEGVFYNAVEGGHINPLEIEREGKRGRLYSRADVIGLAEERKSLASLVSVNQVIETAADHGITLKHKDVMRLAENRQLPTAKRFGRQYYFNAEDVDAAIAGLIDIRVLKERTKGLRETVPAVAWINARLKAMGRNDRVKLSTFYKQVDREILIGSNEVFQPDVRIPAGSKNAAWRWYWSEATLLKHPIFEVPPEMECADEVKPVRVTGSKVLRSLEERWGDLLTRHGIAEEGLSVHSVKGRARKIMPVGYDGTVQWFPARYIPKKQHRRSQDLKEIRDMLNEA
jgi:hypothetical protein